LRRPRRFVHAAAPPRAASLEPRRQRQGATALFPHALRGVSSPPMEWQIPLVVSAVAFGGFLLWRTRPSFGDRGGTVGAKLREANLRLEKARTDGEKGAALADAGDVCARAIGRSGSAVNY